MAAGDIEKNRVGDWSVQAISRLNPGKGVNFIVSGPVTSDLVEGETSTVNLQDGEGFLYIVGMGLRKDSGYGNSMLSCEEVWIPFQDLEGAVHIVRLKVDHRTSYPGWIYIWVAEKTELNAVDRTWMPGVFSEEDIYNIYQQSGHTVEDLDYSILQDGPGSIIFIPYLHPNYYTTDDYNGILGNVMKTEETTKLFSVLRNDVEPIQISPKRNLRDLVSPNLRYKHYLEDYHKFPAIGGTHAGELEIPGGNLSRCEEEGEYFKSFQHRVQELSPDQETLQTLDFPYMSYRAISASVYVDQYTTQSDNLTDRRIALAKVWESMQGGNTDDAETVYFVNPAVRAETSGTLSPYIAPIPRTTIPVTGSILFRMDGHLAVRFTKATLYAPFLNTVFRTGEYGEVQELFTSGSSD